MSKVRQRSVQPLKHRWKFITISVDGKKYLSLLFTIPTARRAVQLLIVRNSIS